MKSEPVLPGSTIGMLGSGQLGRMFAIAAKRMGYRVVIYSPERNTPAGQVSDVEVCAEYLDQDQVQNFAQQVDVVTYEFENIPQQTVELIEPLAPVRPGRKGLAVSQHRVREKDFLRSAGIPVTPYKSIVVGDDFVEADHELFPVIMKTVSNGYDGKGQTRLEKADQFDAGWASLQNQEVILEKVVDFQDEMSVVGVRGTDGSFASYGPIVNCHKDHILFTSVIEAEIPPKVKTAAEEITRTVMDSLDYVGVLCIEFFRTQSDELLVNELAPRPHNSGHLTIEAHVSCQFEQQVRSVCGLPLGSSTCLGPAAMINLLGDLWHDGEPRWAEALSDRAVKLHLYGKAVAKKGRKMGHLTVLAESPEEALKKAVAAYNRLGLASSRQAESPTLTA